MLLGAGGDHGATDVFVWPGRGCKAVASGGSRVKFLREPAWQTMANLCPAEAEQLRLWGVEIWRLWGWKFVNGQVESNGAWDCNETPQFNIGLGVLCLNAQGIAKVIDRSSPSVLKFQCARGSSLDSDSAGSDMTSGKTQTVAVLSKTNDQMWS